MRQLPHWKVTLMLVIKLMLLLVWLLPLLLFFVFGSLTLPASYQFLSELALLLCVVLAAAGFAIPSAFALLTLGVRWRNAMLGVLLFCWLLPSPIFSQFQFVDIPAGNVAVQLWLRLFPVAVIGTVFLVSRIQPSLFDLVSYSHVNWFVLLMRFFVPLLNPGIWCMLAVLLALVTHEYWLLSGHAHYPAFTHVILALLLVTIVHFAARYMPQ